MVETTTLVKRIRAWTIAHCDACRRDRVHFRIGPKWYCIGRLPGAQKGCKETR